MSRSFLLLFVACSLFADIEMQASINDVYYRGEHQQAGSLTFTCNDNDFAGASPEDPIYYTVALVQGARLADTLVDQNSGDERLSKPIYLATELITTRDIVNHIPADAVSIVRWVAGETLVWVKVQSDSSTWIDDDMGGTYPPSSDEKVSWTLGISARSSVFDHATSKNSIPSNTRNLDYMGEADAVSTLLCFDLTMSELKIGELLAHDVEVFGSDAEVSPGLFARTETLPFNFSGGWVLARGKDVNAVESGTVAADSHALIRSAGDGFVSTRGSFSVALRAEDERTHLPVYFNDGSSLVLTSKGNMGFEGENAALFTNCQGAGVARVVPESAFQLGARTLYRQLRLSWNGGRDGLQDLLLTVEAELVGVEGLLDGTPQLDWWLEIALHAGTADEAPFDGVDQARRCAPHMLLAGQGSFTPFKPSGDDRFLPHITLADGNFHTTLTFANTADEDRGFLLYGYDKQGNDLGAYAGCLLAGQRLFQPAPEVFGEALSHLRIAAATDIKVGASYRAIGDGKALAHVHETAERAFSWRVNSGEPNQTFDSLAIVNLGDVSASVTITEYDGLAKTVQKLDSLEPMAKLLQVLNPTNDGTYFIVETSQPCAITALRGSHDASFVWENRATPNTYQSGAER